MSDGAQVCEALPAYIVETNHFNVPPGYKRTEVGIIPAHWNCSFVGREFSVQLGKMLDAARNTGAPKPYLGNRAVQWGRINLDDLALVPLSRSDLQRFQLRRGDLLVCEGGEVGRSAIWNAPISECYYQKALHRLRPLGGYNVYLMRALFELWASTGYLNNFVTQTSIAHLPKDKLEKIPLPVPPPAEQRAIAEALSDVDGLIGALDALIAKKRAIKQAAMQQLLTGKTRLPGFRGKWETKRLGELGSTYGGLTGKTKADFGQGEARYITFMNIMSNTVIDCESFESVVIKPNETQNTVEKGDLFFNGSSETPEEVGMCAVLTNEARNVYLNSFCFGFRPRHEAPINGLYLAYYFRSQQGRELLKSLAQGATRYNLSKTALMAVSFPLPEPGEQGAIATVLSNMDAEIKALEQRREKTRAIKQGTMQQLLTGRVRLVTPEKQAMRP